MRLLPKEAWCYACLLIILFAIASVAVWRILAFLYDIVPREPYNIVAIVIYSITLGFMLIAGAFGLWAIRFSAEAESRRSIAMLVDTMDYISDGLISLDKKGLIIGSNSAASNITGAPLKNKYIADIFPSLAKRDLDNLIHTESPCEIELDFTLNNVSRTLRFRSQPSHGTTLILLSDVTVANELLSRKRQAAQFQLIGQIARGVAYDFNKLLCEISAHATVLERFSQNSDETKKSFSSITRSSEKGIVLARHLLELARPSYVRPNTDIAHEHIRDAAQALQDNLPRGWQIETSLKPLPTIGLTGSQIEQIVLNLGLIAADVLSTPGTLRITSSPPSIDIPFNVGMKFAGVLLISTPNFKTEDMHTMNAEKNSDESGVILSVLQSMIEEAGGILDWLTGGENGMPVFRIALPHGQVMQEEHKDDKFPGEMGTYFTGWSILLATASPNNRILDTRLAELGIKHERVSSITSALAYVEEHPWLDAAIIDRRLLGQESKGLLKALLKLRPSVAITVTCEDPQSESDGLASDIVFINHNSHPNKILLSMIEAKGLAAKRKNKKLS